MFLILGLVIFFYPMIFSGFDLIMGNYDSLYYNYVLEHIRLFFLGDNLHSDFWSAPFNYPYTNSIAQADSLIGIAPIYIFLRLFIKNPITSYQITFVLLCILNYSSFYFLLKRKLNFSDLASSLASFVFAFSILRYFYMYNISYYSQFLSILAIYFFFNININNSKLKNHIYFLMSSILLVIQFYTSFSLGLFFVFTTIFAFLFFLIPKSTRDIVLGFIKAFYSYVIIYLIFCILLLLPMMYHFVQLEEIKPLNMLLGSLDYFTIHLRSVGLLDNLIFHKYSFISHPRADISSMSLGIFTLLIAIFGFLKSKNLKVPLILLILFLFFITSTILSIYFWRVFYFIIFGMESISNLSAFSFMILAVAAFGIAQFYQNTSKKTIIVSSILLLLIANIPLNIDISSSWKNYYISKTDFINRINQKVNPKHLVIKPQNYYNLDRNQLSDKEYQARKFVNIVAMWISLKQNTYTYNNYFPTSKKQDTKHIEHYMVDFSKI